MQLSIFLIVAIFISDCIGPEVGHRREPKVDNYRKQPDQSGHRNHGNGDRIKHPALTPDMSVVQMVKKRPDILFRILEAFEAAIQIDSDLTYLSVNPGRLDRFLPKRFIRNRGTSPVSLDPKVNGEAPHNSSVSPGAPAIGDNKTLPKEPDLQKETDQEESGSQSYEQVQAPEGKELHENDNGKRKKRATGDRDDRHNQNRIIEDPDRAHRKERERTPRIERNKFTRPRSETILIPALQEFIGKALKKHNNYDIKAAKDILEEATWLIKDHFMVHVDSREKDNPPPESSRFDWLSVIFNFGKKHAAQNQQKTDKAVGLRDLAKQVSKEVVANIWQRIAQKPLETNGPLQHNEPHGRDAFILETGAKLFKKATGFYVPPDHALGYLASGVSPKDIDFRLNQLYDLIERVKLVEMKTRIYNFFEEAVKNASEETKEKIIKKYKNFIKEDFLIEEAPFRYKIMPEMVAVINQDECDKAIKEYCNWDRFKVRRGYIKYNAVEWNRRLWKQLRQVKNEFDKIV